MFQWYFELKEVDLGALYGLQCLSALLLHVRQILFAQRRDFICGSLVVQHFDLLLYRHFCCATV